MGPFTPLFFRVVIRCNVLLGFLGKFAVWIFWHPSRNRFCLRCMSIWGLLWSLLCFLLLGVRAQAVDFDVFSLWTDIQRLAIAGCFCFLFQLRDDFALRT